MNGHNSLAALSMIDHRSVTAAPCLIVYIRTSNYIIAKYECKRFFEKSDVSFGDPTMVMHGKLC